MDTETKTDAERFVENSTERFGDYTKENQRQKQLDQNSVMIGFLLEKDPFCLLPIDVRNLRAKHSDPSEMYEDISYLAAIPYKGPLRNAAM
jgi:hypothetical protein